MPENKSTRFSKQHGSIKINRSCVIWGLIFCLSQELEFSNLFAVLHCIHAFFAAKVACLDPMFVESQGTATTTGIASLSSLSCNSQTPKLKYATWQVLLSLTPFKKDAALNHECGLCRWWTGDLEHVQTRTLWGAAVRTAGIKDLFVRDYLTCLQISQISGTTVGWNFTERLNGHIRCDSKGFFLMWFCLRHPYNQLQKKMQFFSQASLLFYVILLTTCSLSNIDSSLFPTSDGTSLEFLQGKAWTLDMMVWCVICDTWYLTFSFFGVFLRWKLLSIIQFAERKNHFSD